MSKTLEELMRQRGIALTLNGSREMLFTNDRIAITGDGTVAAPSITWESDIDTGLYSTAEDCLGMAQGGNDLGQLAGIQANGAIQAQQFADLDRKKALLRAHDFSSSLRQKNQELKRAQADPSWWHKRGEIPPIEPFERFIWWIDLELRALRMRMLGLNEDGSHAETR